jgi:DNA-binding response OmpR family regulator
MKARVLVIEDDRDIAFGVRIALTRNGFDMADSADGKQGLRAFHATHPDLGRPRYRASRTRRLDSLGPHPNLSDVPVLILTAHGHEADKVRGLK